MNAITAFQRMYELPITGITDQRTWDRIVEIYDGAIIRIGPAEPIEIILDPGEVFRIGDSNAYIYLLQSILVQLSKDNPTIATPYHNGVFDNATSEALAAFQLLAGLPPTGELDRITWKYLSKQFSLSASKDKY
jgi:murein L,D-transpeptidase YcbB/YkuD